MKHEFWAHFDLYDALNKDEFENKNILDGMVNKISNELPKDWELLDNFSRLQILAATLASNKTVKWIDKGKERQISVKDYARTGALQYKEKSGLLYWYDEGNYQEFLKEHLRWMGDILNLINNHDTVSPSLPDISLFPPGSWAIQIHFTLRKPYLSKDDVDFYIVDNPVKKEWVFKVPYVAPSQWKGALRAAMTRQLAEESKALEDWIERRLQLTRFFGNEKGVDLDDERFETYLDRQKPEAAKQYRQRLKEEYTQTGFLAGRLHFYPTFFDHIGLEVINPHPRDTGAGKQPIYFECVPAGTPGVFTLLYVPLDAGPKDTDTIKTDLHAVARGVRAMLTQYGFGAKTSSGYGVAKDDVVQGIMLLNFAEIPESLKAKSQTQPEYEPPEEVFLKYMDESGEVKPEFKGSGEGGLMSNSEYKQRGEALGGGSLKEFKRFRSWYVKHGTNWKASRETSPENSDTSAKQQITFQTLSEFEKIVEILISDGGKHA